MNTLTRLSVFLSLCIAALFAPSLAVMVVALVGAFFFPLFWEAVAVGIFLDVLYATPEPRWFGFQFLYTLLASITLLFIEVLKKHIRIYHRRL